MEGTVPIYPKATTGYWEYNVNKKGLLASVMNQKARQKDPTFRFFKSTICLFKLYLVKNQRNNSQLPMKKNSMFIRLLTVKDTRGTNLRTSHPTAFGERLSV